MDIFFFHTQKYTISYILLAVTLITTSTRYFSSLLFFLRNYRFMRWLMDSLELSMSS